MTTRVKIKRPTPKRPTRPRVHPHVNVSSAAGTVVLGAVDERTGIEGLGSTWVTIDRAGTNALLRRATRNRMRYTVPATLINGLGGKTVEQQLLALDAICASRAVCGVSYAEMSRHRWQLTEVSGTTRNRQAFSNAILHADVTLTFIVVVQEHLDRQPPPSTSRRQTPPSNRAKAKVTSYVVKAGDTLSKIAATVYGNANRWPEIAKLNGLRNPTAIKPGQRLKV